MKTFIEYVVEDLYRECDGDLSHTAVIFPGKRAGLWFDEHLARISDGPVWSPDYLSISDLFRSVSSLEVADDIKLVAELYAVYRDVTEKANEGLREDARRKVETLDEFYFWGEMLLADFDDADKNMVRTDMLFSNLRELHDMDSLDFLDDEQRETLSIFFNNFSPERTTRLKQEFLNIWDSLGPIYNGLREKLLKENLAYEGMLYRDVAENDMIDFKQLGYDHIAVVGFNVLNRVEQKLFGRLQKQCGAWFYWDYDEYYTKSDDNEAGEFLKRNLSHFPNKLSELDIFDNIRKNKRICFAESPTENAQAAYLKDWLGENMTSPEKDTAVVLCNEKLLPGVLNFIPENVKDVNVTMGYPISQTPVFSFVEAFNQLHIMGYNEKSGRFNYSRVLTMLRHPYTRGMAAEGVTEAVEQELLHNNVFYPSPSYFLCREDEFLNLVFAPIESERGAHLRRLTELLKKIASEYAEINGTPRSKAFDQLYMESLFRAYTIVVRFSDLEQEGCLDVKPRTMMRLMNRVFSSSGIPFHGEPAIGLQVMGLLETRALDFRHIVMLSVNEGMLPKGVDDSSFIPYNLRKAFGMTTIDHKVAVFAYYFYRLLQRAEDITYVYNTSTDGMGRGEMSRFMHQLAMERGGIIERVAIDAPQTPLATSLPSVKKTPAIMERLRRRFDPVKGRILSPSAINSYIDCPLDFYYRYIAGLKERDEVGEDIDNAAFGTIFHKVAEDIYNDLMKRNHKMITADLLDGLIKDEKKIYEYVDRAFKIEFFKMKDLDRESEYNGLQLINREVIFRYIRRLLEFDRHYAPFSFVKAEEKIQKLLPAKENGRPAILLGGYIDRVDIKGDTMRIVDYKTGGKYENDKAPDIQSLFTPSKSRSGNVFQAFYYSMIKQEQISGGLKLRPALLRVARISGRDDMPCIKIGKEDVEDFGCYVDEFRHNLDLLLDEIFSPEGEFAASSEDSSCKYCDYQTIRW